MKRCSIRVSTFVLLAGGFVACASVPKESVELSMAVGEGIKGMQVSHEAFVQEYFRLSRDRVEDFLVNRWLPEFLETFVRDSKIMEMLDQPAPLPPDDVARLRAEVAGISRLSDAQQTEVVLAVQRAMGDADRGALAIEFAQAAMDAIETQRNELLAPIKNQETRALRELRAAYAQLLSMQDAITAQLQSVNDVQVQQDEVLARLGALEARDAALQSAVQLNDQIVGLLSNSGSAMETVDQIKDVVNRVR
jgi:hypothetical protein